MVSDGKLTHHLQKQPVMRRLPSMETAWPRCPCSLAERPSTKPAITTSLRVSGWPISYHKSKAERLYSEEGSASSMILELSKRVVCSRKVICHIHRLGI